jgi:hypothetical protein
VSEATRSTAVAVSGDPITGQQADGVDSARGGAGGADGTPTQTAVKKKRHRQSQAERKRRQKRAAKLTKIGWKKPA